MMRVAAGVLMVAAAMLTAGAQERADLTGAWKLNAELTTRPVQRIDVNRPPAPRRSPIGGSGMPMGGGRPGSATDEYNARRENPDDDAKAREAMRLSSLIPERLTVVRSGQGFALTDGEGVSQTLVPDGKTTKSALGALKFEMKAKWDDGALTVERKFESGVKAVERYTVTASPRRLVIAVRLENTKTPGDRERTFQRVYDIQE